jgi:trehalose 6-phosphate phosphatase
MEFTSSSGQERYDAFVAVASTSIVGLDFDGTLAPIVDDPAEAVIHPEGPRVLTELAGQVRAVVVVTGRPARQVVELGRLEEVADGLAAGGRLVVMGQYGNEHWDSGSREFRSPEPPPGLQAFRDELPALLAAQDADGAFVEEKGLAVAVHTRRLPDPSGAFDRLLPELEKLAEKTGLVVEPGRQVIEARAGGTDKGEVVRNLTEKLPVGGFLFAGDDLGDVEAFDAVAELREQGLPTFLVCSGSEEQRALAGRADLVVDGPAGVLGLLARFAEDVRSAQDG